MSTRIIETEFSTYEVDTVNKRIRRLKGVNQPTERQGEDMVWKTYARMNKQLTGSYLIEWEGITQGPMGSLVGPMTLTSPVVNEYEKSHTNAYL